MNNTTNIKTTIIRSLLSDTKKSSSMIYSLNKYAFVHNVSNLIIGSYIRWIDLTKKPYTLQNVVCLINIEIMDTYISIVCKTFRNKYFKKRYDDLIIFRKYS